MAVENTHWSWFLAHFLTICWACCISEGAAAAASVIPSYTGSSIMPNCECTGQKGNMSFCLLEYLLKTRSSPDLIQLSLKGMKQNSRASWTACPKPGKIQQLKGGPRGQDTRYSEDAATRRHTLLFVVGVLNATCEHIPYVSGRTSLLSLQSIHFSPATGPEVLAI